MLALGIFERHAQVDLSVDLDVVHLERVADAALVHRAVEELDRLDRGGVESWPPVPVAVRKRVREHAPVRVRRLEGEVHVDLVEPLPDLPEVLDQGLVELEPCDVLFSDVLDDFPGLLLELRVQGGEPIIRSEEHTSELQSRFDLVCRLLLEKKKYTINK